MVKGTEDKGNKKCRGGDREVRPVSIPDFTFVPVQSCTVLYKMTVVPYEEPFVF